MNDNIKIPADEERQVDDLFRNTLGDHTVEPSVNLWKGINRKLLWNEISRFNFTNLSQVYWIAGTAAITMIIGLLLFSPGTKQSIQPNSQKTQEKTVNVKSEGNAITFSSTGKTETKPIVGKPSTTYSIIHKPVISNTSQEIASISKSTSTFVNTSSVTNHPSEADRDIINPSSSSEQWSILMLNPLSIAEFSIIDLMDTVISFRTPLGIMRVQKEKPGMHQSFSTDFGVTPELINYNTTHSYSEMNYWLNAKIAYHFSKFSIQTGVALGYVFDEGKYNTKYISKDSIGYFTSVISFYVDPVHQNELIFNTKNVAVYDSLKHYADDRTRNRYTYLEFPLLLGYQLFETNKLSLDILAGPAFTVLIGTREAQPFIDYPNARIIRINDNTPQRVKTNWKIAIGLHLEYRVTKKLGCYLEPSYKYYFNSFIKKEQTSSQEPYSVGIGLGIRFHFGQIKK